MAANNSTCVEERNETNFINNDPLISLTIPALMFASGVIGNLLAISVLARSSREHKQTVFYRLVGALACTDLFGTCATSPVTLAVYANNLKWVGGQSLCNYEAFIFVFASFATVLIIGLMAIDRFVAIKHPFFYDHHITADKTKCSILGIWIFAAFMGCLPILGLGQVVKQFPGTWCFFNFISAKMKNKIFVYAYAIILLLVVAITAASNIIVTIVLLNMRRKALHSMNSCFTKRNDSELQMMVLLLGITIIFSSCWCPFIIRVLINQIREAQKNLAADLHTLRLASLNQILDPWVYILFRKELLARITTFLKANTFTSNYCCCENIINDEMNVVDRNNIVYEQTQTPFVQCVKYVNISGDLLGLDNDIIQSQDDKEIILNEQPSSVCFSETEVCEKRYNTRERVRHNLHFIHSACLFCLSNHHRSILISALTESTSVGSLELIQKQEFTQDFPKRQSRHSDTLKSQRKRDSIHISLTDIRCTATISP